MFGRKRHEGEESIDDGVDPVEKSEASPLEASEFAEPASGPLSSAAEDVPIAAPAPAAAWRPGTKLVKTARPPVPVDAPRVEDEGVPTSPDEEAPTPDEVVPAALAPGEETHVLPPTNSFDERDRPDEGLDESDRADRLDESADPAPIAVPVEEPAASDAHMVDPGPSVVEPVVADGPSIVPDRPPIADVPPLADAPLSDGSEFQSDRGDRRAAPFAIALLLAALVGAGVWFFMDSRADRRTDAAYARGERAGERATASEYRRGASGYDRIFAAGKTAGTASGTAAGRESGVTAGRRSVVEELRQTSTSRLQPAPQGEAPNGNPLTVRRAGSTALGGFPDWSRGALYAVRIGEGPGLLPFQIISRNEIEEGRLYRVCPKRPGRLCEVAIPEAEGVPGQSESSAESADPSEATPDPGEATPDPGETVPRTKIDPEAGLPPDPTDSNARP